MRRNNNRNCTVVQVFSRDRGDCFSAKSKLFALKALISPEAGRDRAESALNNVYLTFVIIMLKNWCADWSAFEITEIRSI
jgi:hypothetical protein